jgi:hypothetical protein
MRRTTKRAAALAAALAGAVALPAAASATTTAAGAKAATTGNVALTPNMAGYEAQVAEFGVPFTGVQATYKLPKVTKVSSTSYAYADYVAAIGEANGNGVLAGVGESMVYGAVSYTAFAAFGTQVDTFPALTVKPGDTITVTVSFAAAGTWHTQVLDKTTGKSASDTQPASVGGWDAEVILLRPANPIGPGYLPLAGTTPVTFDHAKVTNADNNTYPFAADVPSATIPVTYVMLNDALTKLIAGTSQPDSDSDGFAVQDGKTPPPPKS